MSLKDADGVSLPDAIGAFGVDLDSALDARSELENAAAYLELHIEQGPVLESMDLPLGAVLGTFGVERHRITWRGQAAHAGSTPMDQRRDALAGAAKLALELRVIAAEVGDGAVLTSGGVVCKPGIVTSVVETAEQLLDMRHLDAEKLAAMNRAAHEASERFADEESLQVEWERIWQIEPILFELADLAEDAVREVAGTSHRLPSGPLHDAAEVSRAGVPTAMLFVQSLRGLSHTKLEDTKPEHLELAVQALDRLATKTLARSAGRTPERPSYTRSMAVCRICGQENPEIAKFCLACGAPLVEELSSSPDVRKTITVVFADVVGSTALGEQLDAESFRRVIGRYFDEMQLGRRASRRQGREVHRRRGDGRLRHSRRARGRRAACRARRGRDARRARTRSNEELERELRRHASQVRTGVNTGEVVAGDPVGEQRLVDGRRRQRRRPAGAGRRSRRDPDR